MKYLAMVLAFTFCSVSFAQDRKSDTKTETETKTVKVKTEQGTTEKRVRVTTKEEGEIKLKENPDHYENMTRVDSESKVTQTVSFSTDYDPFYETDIASKSFMSDDSEYMFTSSDNGFTMSTNNDADESNEIGSAMMTSTKKLYLIDMGGQNGIGYFNKDGNFVVEYYDKESQSMVKKEFKGIDQ